jgi:type IV pilus assembly protein PilC
MTMTTTIDPAPSPTTPGPVGTDLTPHVAWYRRQYYIGRAVKPEIVMNFTRQLSSFVRSGIAILDALAIVGEEATDKKMAETIAAIEKALRAGKSLGDAIGEHPKVFPGYFISMVRAAELTGKLDEVLEQLAEYMERDLSARRQVKSALTYPTFVMGLAVVAVVVISAYVLPKFKGLYTSLGGHLPLPTRMLLGITDFFANDLRGSFSVPPSSAGCRTG